MKKIFFVDILSTLLAGAVSAQPRIGVTAGGTASNISRDNGQFTARCDWRFGFEAGVVADFGITNNFSVIPELLFAQRGTINTMRDKSTYTLNYLQLPVNFAYKLNVGHNSKLMVFAGPYAGYGLSGSLKGPVHISVGNESLGSIDIKIPFEFQTKEQDYENLEELKMYFKPLDFGINAGLGYEVGNMFFKAQYNHGFTNYSNDKNVSFKNLNISISIGYFFY